MRTLFFGTAGHFSSIVLQALVEAEVPIVGVVMAAPRGTAVPIKRLMLATEGTEGTEILTIPLVSSYKQSFPHNEGVISPLSMPSVAQIAAARSIPVYGVARLKAAETLDTLASLGAEIGATACFPRLLPACVLELMPHGILNVHPSLLPALRGPDPLEQALQQGLSRTGVTIHRMDQDFDTGPIIIQEEFAIPPGMSFETLEERAAHLGGRLLTKVIKGATFHAI
jgi:methionyl-tRNA formyltransferase